MSVLNQLLPHEVWDIFEEITQIPRPSKKEQKIHDYLVDFAKKHDLKYKTDEAGNVVILKPGTSGYENHPAVVLQSHMDMVCEKHSDITFDFEKDPIQPRIEGEWVKATGTTLGADDGIGMAAAMAVLIATDLKHGPLEALFTVDEETGLTGAFNLGKDMLTGQYLINLDSEDEGELFIGCAGGIDTVATFHPLMQAAPKEYGWFRVNISGLKGGHSGDDIDKGLGNSNRLLARLLHDARPQGLRLSHFDGGNLRNAIPREAYAVFGVPLKSVRKLFERFETFTADITAELKYTDPGLQTAIAEEPQPESVMDEKTQDNLVDALIGVPNGVLAMSYAMPGLVETSTNLASVKFKDGNTIVVTSSQRSSVESSKLAAAASIEAVYRLAGAVVTHSDGYPGWAPDPASHLLKVTEETYKTLFGKEPKVRAIHAGLECGLFLKKYPHLEMVSFGPTLRGVHSPDERLEITTVDKFWKLLVATLERL